MTPDQVIAEMKKGNERFRAGKMNPHDYLAQQRTSAVGQYPASVVLGCIDSRAPGEILFDAGIGEAFNARIAGNVVNDDLLGSMEFACAVAGAKAVVVFGHTACGAVKGAIDDVEMGNLTGLLARIKPAITATTFDGEKSSKNAGLRRRRGADERRGDARQHKAAQPDPRRSREEGIDPGGRRDVRPGHGEGGVSRLGSHEDSDAMVKALFADWTVAVPAASALLLVAALYLPPTPC